MFPDMFRQELFKSRHLELLTMSEHRTSLLRPAIIARAFSLCRGGSHH
jgi:hypothetical protein